MDLQKALQSGGLTLNSIGSTPVTSGGLTYQQIGTGGFNPATVNTIGSGGSVLGASTNTNSAPSNSGQSKQDLWNSYGRSGTVPIGWNGESYAPGQQQNDLNAQIDALFNPVMDLYNQQENYLRNTDYPTEVQGINNANLDLQDQLTNQQTKSNQTLDSQTNDLNRAQVSALAQANAAYQAMKQSAQVKFGGGNSAGQALGELAQKQYFKSNGDVNSSYLSSLGKINQARSDLDSFVDQNKMKLSRDKDQQMAQLDSQLQQQLLQINSNRAQTEQAKAQQKIQAIQQQLAAAQQINMASKQAEINIDAYKQQLQAQLDAGAATLNSQSSSINTNPFNTPTSIMQPNQQSQTTAPYLQGGNILGFNQNDQNNPFNFLG